MMGLPGGKLSNPGRRPEHKIRKSRNNFLNLTLNYFSINSPFLGLLGIIIL